MKWNNIKYLQDKDVDMEHLKRLVKDKQNANALAVIFHYYYYYYYYTYYTTTFTEITVYWWNEIKKKDPVTTYRQNRKKFLTFLKNTL